MKWLLIVTLMGAESAPLEVRTPYPTEDICERAGTLYMDFVQRENPTTTASFECKPNSPFVVELDDE